jgi:hypothetical protein
MRPKKTICCVNNLLSLIHVLLPVAAEASKHGAHHETKESHLLCDLDVGTSLDLEKNHSMETTTQEFKILREYSFSYKNSHFP